MSGTEWMKSPATAPPVLNRDAAGVLPIPTATSDAVDPCGRRSKARRSYRRGPTGRGQTQPNIATAMSQELSAARRAAPIIPRTAPPPRTTMTHHTVHRAAATHPEIPYSTGWRCHWHYAGPQSQGPANPATRPRRRREPARSGHRQAPVAGPAAQAALPQTPRPHTPDRRHPYLPRHGARAAPLEFPRLSTQPSAHQLHHSSCVPATPPRTFHSGVTHPGGAPTSQAGQPSCPASVPPNPEQPAPPARRSWRRNVQKSAAHSPPSYPAADRAQDRLERQVHSPTMQKEFTRGRTRQPIAHAAQRVGASGINDAVRSISRASSA